MMFLVKTLCYSNYKAKMAHFGPALVTKTRHVDRLGKHTANDHYPDPSQQASHIIPHPSVDGITI